MCGGPRPFARAVGGCAGAVRWERLPRDFGAGRAVGCRQTDIFCPDGCSPADPGGEGFGWGLAVLKKGLF